MSRSTYAPKETYVGAGNLAVYTFDFKIEAEAQLLVIEVDDSGVETERVLGDDTVYLSGIVFNAVEGGGTVTLAANLPTDYDLIFLLANDAPTQPYQFRNKTSFSLPRFESALDFISGAVQRLTYRGKQAFRIHDLDDEDTFNPQFPPGVDEANNKVLIINSDADGMDYGPTAAEIASAEAFAIAAEAAKIAAQIAQTGAETAETAAQLAQSIVESYYKPIATETISNGGTIAHTQSLVGYRQFRRITASSAITTSNKPFGTNATYFVDGMVIKLESQSASNTIIINHNDAQYGCLLNGNWQGGKGNVLELTYNSTLQRFIESFRKI